MEDSEFDTRLLLPLALRHLTLGLQSNTNHPPGLSPSHRRLHNMYPILSL